MDNTGIPAHGGERVAAALAANGVRFIFTLCGGHISPILVAAKARGIRIIDTRDEATAVFAADAVARLTGTTGVAAVTAGPGLTNTITALKNAQLAQSPVLLLGGAAPTALQGRGALQDIAQKPLIAPHVKWLKQVRRVADLGSAVEEALVVAREGVPGPTFVECPVDLLYDEKLIRGWYADAAGKGMAIADRALRWYLERHAARMFAGSGVAYAPVGRAVAVGEASEAAIARAAEAFAKAERPLLVIGSQTLVEASEAAMVAAAVDRLGVPVYLSGMARGLLGRDASLQMRHARRQALRESDCVLLAGVPCDFRLDYGRHVRRAATLVAANRSPRDARLNRKPSIEAIGDAGRFIAALADRVGERAKRPEWIVALDRRDAEREAEIDAQARLPGGRVNPVGFFRALDRAAGVEDISYQQFERDPAAEDRLEPPGLLLTPGDLRDEADPEQREEEGSEEAELVLDDPAETVDALDPAVDRDERVTGGDGLGVGVDLLGGGVEAGYRRRCCDHAGDEREHPDERAAAVRPPLDTEHGPQAGRPHQRASSGSPSSVASRGTAWPS